MVFSSPLSQIYKDAAFQIKRMSCNIPLGNVIKA